MAETNGGYDTGIPHDEMSVEELREEYAELHEQMMSGVLEANRHDRMMGAWNELRERTEVEQPECPECGARNWGFSDHTECRDCAFGPADTDLLNDIQSAWDSIMHAEVSA
ncbi:hypothetical protein [Haloprofundus halobius]|uniref:hypothetical protein n=1 Tax=Haloprofundus halobius TaxID=2876194 RepID=UPI001CD02B13|nr:hypothetical protein [Haloprofundus halobius]